MRTAAVYYWLRGRHPRVAASLQRRLLLLTESAGSAHDHAQTYRSVIFANLIVMCYFKFEYAVFCGIYCIYRWLFIALADDNDVALVCRFWCCDVCNSYNCFGIMLSNV